MQKIFKSTPKITPFEIGVVLAAIMTLVFNHYTRPTPAQPGPALASCEQHSVSGDGFVACLIDGTQQAR